VPALAALGRATYADTEPLDAADTPEPLTVERVAADEYVMSVALPHADRREIDLARSGDDLVLTVAGHRRLLALPSALRRCIVDGAALREGRLRVRFRPDPDLWMRP
jgi:arsenite-transporting ATPase